MIKNLILLLALLYSTSPVCLAAAEDGPPPDVPIPTSDATLLITTVLLKTSASSKEEFVEITNVSNGVVSLADWHLRKVTKSGNESVLVARGKFPEEILPAHTIRIAHQSTQEALAADAAFSGKSYTIAKDSSVLLYNDDVIVDLVGFGDAALFLASPTPNPSTNEVLQRKRVEDDFAHTERNAEDFIIVPWTSVPLEKKSPSAEDAATEDSDTETVPDSATSPAAEDTVPKPALPVVISEVLPDPIGTDATAELIELYNPHETAVTLTDYTLSDASEKSTLTFTATEIAPGGFLTLLRGRDFSFSLNNAGDTLTLRSPDATVIDTIEYQDAPEGLSWQRVVDGTWRWQEPSPEYIAEAVLAPHEKTFPDLLLTEVLANPSDDEAQHEYIELYNPHNTTIDLKDWVLRDASKTGNYILPNVALAPKHYYTVYRSDFRLALNNTSETVTLLQPNGSISSTVSYEKTREDVSYSRTTDGAWRHTQHRTPGAPNTFNDAPRIVDLRYDKKIYKNITTSFAVEIADDDHSNHTVRWDFGDGRRSYKEETSHRYTKNGRYTVTLTISDGVEDLIENFTVHVRTFEPPSVEIIEVLPNPAGPDRGAEHVILKNFDRNTIDLQDWSLATGTSPERIVNHPIRDALLLEAGDTVKITTAHAAISVPNTTGVIELRAPEGTIVDAVAYDYAKGIPQDALYQKTAHDWHWRIPEKPAPASLDLRAAVWQNMSRVPSFAALRLSETSEHTIRAATVFDHSLAMLQLWVLRLQMLLLG